MKLLEHRLFHQCFGAYADVADADAKRRAALLYLRQLHIQNSLVLPAGKAAPGVVIAALGAINAPNNLQR
jgi:hypothetical protein